MAIGFTDLTSTVRTPDKGMTKSSSATVHKIQFGDGYMQRVTEGINPIKESYQVSFSNRTITDIDDIVAFLDNKKGVTAFNFTVPDTNSSGNEKTIKVICESYNLNWINGIASTVSATFLRVYEP